MDFEVLKKITLTRQTIKEFNSRQLDQGVMEEILGYSLVSELQLLDSQRTPTSMNLQPYRMIIVRDAEVKESLSLCMSKKNENTVREAAASIIVCSDMRENCRWIRDVQSLISALKTLEGLHTRMTGKRRPLVFVPMVIQRSNMAHHDSICEVYAEHSFECVVWLDLRFDCLCHALAPSLFRKNYDAVVVATASSIPHPEHLPTRREQGNQLCHHERILGG